ncbi:MAG: NIPSNAP family protein [Verrucomicrobiia bacterium]|tara:strand:- start:2687 stop:3118 length:432 start_codon:yes stop_codon:yes gene_type:complete
MTKRLLLTLTLFVVASFSAPLLSAAHHKGGHADRVFEYRVYTVNPGKMPNLLARFRDHTVGIFERLGAENIGYWVETEPADGEEAKLHYIIAHASRDASKAFWATFRDDAAWKAAAKASTVDGKIVKKVAKTFMAPTDFSAIK